MEKAKMNQQTDIFGNSRIVPTAGIAKSILLFDNFNGYNPIVTLGHIPNCKLWQTTVFTLLQGHVTFKVNGDTLNLRAGQCLTTLPDCVFEFIEASENVRFMLYVIYPETFIKTFEDLRVNYDITRISGRYDVVTFPEADLKYQFNLFLETKDEILKTEGELKYNYIRCFLNVLLANNTRLTEDKATVVGDTSSRQYDVYKRFLIDLNEHADKERSVNYYANLQDISAKYLSFVCIQYSKKNASSWIDEYVATKAKALISVHHMSTQELCDALNFTSSSSFIRYFKRVTGMSPKEYAHSLKK